MRKVFKLMIALVVLVIAGIIAIPFFIPVDAMKDKVLGKIEAATGRKVGIQTISLSVFPDIALKVEGVSVGNPAWAGTGDMADIKALRLGVELMPLLHKEVNIKEFTLESPIITLIKKGEQANWQMGATEPAKPQLAPAQKEKQEGAQDLGSVIPGHISIRNGTVVYKDMTAGTEQKISDLNLDLKAPNPSEKAVLDVSAVFGGQKADVSLELGKPLTITSGTPSGVDLKLGYGALKFAWQGTLALKANRPELTGKITIPKIDTADFAQKQPAGEAKPAAARASGSGHWSDAPIDMSALNSADADLTIIIERLVLPKTSLDNVQLAVHLLRGALNVKTNDVSAYGGTLAALLDAGSAGTVGADVKVANVHAEPLLQDFAGYDKLSGTMNAQVKVASRGKSQRALVNALAGQGAFNFKDGKLKGADIAGLVRNIRSGGQGGSEQSTDFSELSGTFTITGGVASNTDLKMNSPLLRVTGTGTADLPNWQVQYLLQPMLVGSLEGQGGKNAQGITIPIRVQGPLDNPSYRPDLQAALQQNVTIKNAAGALKGNAGAALQNLLR